MEEEYPVFVKIDKYKEVIDLLGQVKSRLREAKEILGRINEIKNEEDAELEIWHTTLEELERKTEFIDKMLFEPEVF